MRFIISVRTVAITKLLFHLLKVSQHQITLSILVYLATTVLQLRQEA